MKLSSNAFVNRDSIPSKFTCDGKNISPPLEIKDVPENTQSLALIANDPDAPVGNWIHWVVWNILPSTYIIDAGILPDGAVEGMTNFGRRGYGGPCPPSGEHRYFFTLYALDIVLNVPQTATAMDLKRAMEGHILEQSQLIGTYSRS